MVTILSSGVMRMSEIQDIGPEEPRESRTAQFYQAHADATSPLKAKYEAEAKKAKYHLALGHISRDNPDPAPRLKIRLGGPSHTRLSQVPARASITGTQ